jgi:hypothetical protein
MCNFFCIGKDDKSSKKATKSQVELAMKNKESSTPNHFWSFDYFGTSGEEWDRLMSESIIKKLNQVKKDSNHSSFDNLMFDNPRNSSTTLDTDESTTTHEYHGGEHINKLQNLQVIYANVTKCHPCTNYDFIRNFIMISFAILF